MFNLRMLNFLTPRILGKSGCVNLSLSLRRFWDIAVFLFMNLLDHMRVEQVDPIEL